MRVLSIIQGSLWLVPVIVVLSRRRIERNAFLDQRNVLGRGDNSMTGREIKEIVDVIRSRLLV